MGEAGAWNRWQQAWGATSVGPSSRGGEEAWEGPERQRGTHDPPGVTDAA